jgi:prepilin-type N-terminal cleavage/methylation domain-containing protein
MRSKTGGFTLTELVISLGVLLIVAVLAGSVFLSAMEAYGLNKQLQDDQYNVRTALLSIIQDAHRSADASAGADRLTLSGPGGTVTYTVIGGGLRRNGEALTEEGSLTALAASVSGSRLTLTVRGRHNLELTTQVMLKRIPL